MLSDPRLSKPLARISALLELIETYNDPLVRRGERPEVRAQRSPSSQTPGRLQCDWAAREAERLLSKTADDLQKVITNATPRDVSPESITSVGGVDIGEPASGREAAQRLGREARIRSQLVAKAAALGVLPKGGPQLRFAEQRTGCRVTTCLDSGPKCPTGEGAP